MSKELVKKLQRENYQKIVSYLMRHPEEVSRIDNDHFLDPLYKGVHRAIQTIHDRGMEVTFDEVFTYSKEELDKLNYRGSLRFEDVESIYENFTEFANIKQIIKKVKDEYIKTQETSLIIEDLITVYGGSDSIPLEKLRELNQRIQGNIHFIESDEISPEMVEVIKRYEKEVAGRSSINEDKRSLGYAVLDKNIPNGAAPGHMMSIFGESGSGKSLFVQSIVNRLVNKGIPVAYYSLEMPLEDVIDRFVSFRRNIYIDDILDAHKNPRIATIVKREKDKLSKLPNLHVYTPDSMSIEDFDRNTNISKEIWSARGILPEDGYNVAVIDLVTMLEDCESFDPRELERVVNKLKRVYSKNKTFLIVVLQANQNQKRSGDVKFRKPEDVKRYELREKDIKHGSAFFERSRLVASIIRRKEIMKMAFKDEPELWIDEPDLLEFDLIKANKSKTFFCKFSFQVRPSYEISYFQDG